MVTEEQIWEALHAVIDPELGVDFVDLGLVYAVRIEGSDVHIDFTLTTPACGIGPAVADEMDDIVGSMDGVANVFPRMTFDPPWTSDMMSEDAKFALGML